MKFYLFILISLVTLALTLTLVESRKNKKRAKKPRKEKDPLDKRPTDVKPELYCDACQAMVKESVKLLRGKKKYSDVLNVVDEICAQDNFYVYSHPPPEMMSGCFAFQGGWQDELIDVIVNRTSVEQAIQKMCTEISKACVDVDPKNAPRMDENIFVDGQPVDIKNVQQSSTGDSQEQPKKDEI